MLRRRRFGAVCLATAYGLSWEFAAAQSPPAAPLAEGPAPTESVAAESSVPPSPDGGEHTAEDAEQPAGTSPPEPAAEGRARAWSARPQQAKAPTPPASPWKPLFFDNDFSAYVGKEPYVFGEELKQMPLDLPGDECDFTLDIGGQLRHRYELHDNQIRPNGFKENTFELWRWRQYFDLKSDYVRFYVETIDASSVGEDLPPLPPDVNRFDLLNAFVDLKVYDAEDYGVGTFRYGRQELFYGKQRSMSPSDWSNIRRNFEGFKFIHKAEGWRFDAWALNPVNTAARGGVQQAEFDTARDKADRERTFYGGYLTMNANSQASVDLYMLYQDDERPRKNFAEGDRGMNAARFYGVVPTDASEVHVWDYDVEGGYEWGSDIGRRVVAGFATTEIGHTWKKAAWKPRIGGLFYYGSGGSPTAEDDNTYYAWYPLGHSYWDQNDNLSGQNLIDLAVTWSFEPTSKLNFTGAYHGFWKADDDDFLYNVAQVPVGSTNNGTSIGQEASVIGTYTVNPNLSFQTGYAHFWYGEVGKNITGKDGADFFYAMTTFNY